LNSSNPSIQNEAIGDLPAIAESSWALIILKVFLA